MAELPKARKSADQPNLPNSPECGQWETLLVDALDGLLTPEDEATFTAHMAICDSCSAMFEQGAARPGVAGVFVSRAAGTGWAAG